MAYAEYLKNHTKETSILIVFKIMKWQQKNSNPDDRPSCPAPPNAILPYPTTKYHGLVQIPTHR